MTIASGLRDRDPRHLHPATLRLCNEHRTQAAQDPMCGPTALIETFRTAELQDADFSRGRAADGMIVDASAVVTQSRGGESWHGLMRWIWACPDCGHDRRLHLGAAAGGAILCCSDEGHNLGEACACAVQTDRMAAAGGWASVPASLAYHLALHCLPGCHPAGTLLGFGAHSRLLPADLLRYRRLGELGQGLSLRWGGDWNGNQIPFEAGENDLTHFEFHAGGTLAQVQTALAIRGGDLSWAGHGAIPGGAPA